MSLMPSLRTTFPDYERRPDFGGRLVSGEGDELDPEYIASMIAAARPQKAAVAGPRGMGMSQPQESLAGMLSRKFSENLRWSGDPEVAWGAADPTAVARVPAKADPKMKGSAGQEPMVDTPTPLDSVGPLAGGYRSPANDDAANLDLDVKSALEPLPSSSSPRGSIRFSLDGGKTFKEYDPQGRGDQVKFDPGRARQDSFSSDAPSVDLHGGGEGAYGTATNPESEAREKARGLPGLAAELEAAHMKTRLEREKPFDPANPPTPTGQEAIDYQEKVAAWEAKQAKENEIVSSVAESLRALREGTQRFGINPKDPMARSPENVEAERKDIMALIAILRNNPAFMDDVRRNGIQFPGGVPGQP